MNLASILKMLGVKIPPDKLKAIEEFIPQVPAKGQQVINAVNFALKNFDERLQTIEETQRLMVAVLVGEERGAELIAQARRKVEEDESKRIAAANGCGPGSTDAGN